MRVFKIKNIQRGILFIVTAPSGAGKTSLVDAILKRCDEICVSISYTTRLPRDNEAHGTDYYFTPLKQFEEMRDRDEFFESAEVYGNFYGTSASWIQSKLEEGIDVILEIDWQGARQARKLNSKSTSLFIVPPSVETLEKRLKARGQDDNSIIERRMNQATEELSYAKEADYVVINDQFDVALEEILAIIRSERLKYNSGNA
ncbi:MAG: guanylate kinase [Gammaproteobacteria bacterium]|nr:guanylate kinase [Gammaproteobacteria bacterium]